MEAPENLVEAVTRLKPRAVLLLDTNTLMNPPRLDSYEIAAQGRFLLVVPRIVSIELAKIRRGGRDEESKRKASRPLKLLDELYERGRPVEGIDIGDGRWLVTADTPRPPTPNDTSIEDKMIQKNLGSVDICIILGICQQLNYLQNSGHGCWSFSVASQVCMSDRRPTVSGSSRLSSG